MHFVFFYVTKNIEKHYHNLLWFLFRATNQIECCRKATMIKQSSLQPSHDVKMMLFGRFYDGKQSL